ncbi:MAG: sulfotransferase [Desulfuromonadales bacterium]|nr:sulfotransferase [Desulfuromonadales bacterium]
MNNTTELIQKANACTQRKDFQEAINIYKQVLQDEPNHIDASYLLGSVYGQLGELDSARELLLKAHQLRPGSPYICTNLGNLFKMSGKLAEAARFYRKAISLKWDIPQAHCGLGEILSQHGMSDEAIRCFENANKIQPGVVNMNMALAYELEKHGDYQRARTILKPLIEAGQADHRTLVTYVVTLLHEQADQEDLLAAGKRLHSFLDNCSDRISAADTGHCWLVLGQCYDAAGDFAAAFSCFTKGNRLLATPFDEQGYFSRLASLRSAYAPENLKDLTIAAGDGADLIFIVGMPRSGTTLIEQILNTHPEVGSLGETGYFSKARTAVCSSGDRELSREELSRVSASYRGYLPETSQGIRLLTDKTLNNFIELGHIAQVFPKARVVNCSRNVLDTCISCYSHRFNGYMPYTYDLHALGRYCRGYLDIMNFWANTLELRILDLNYEALIADPEKGVRGLLDFCDLPWDDACLSFHENSRFAKTASYHQVRKPIYSSSVGRYKNYEIYLEPFKQALEGR